MPLVKVTKVQIPERYRKDLGDIEQLAKDIKDKGQLQPIVLDEEYTLMAGGRRLAAVTMLGWEEIRATIVSAEDELARREIELMENFSRKDMTWDEEVTLKKKIHELQIEKCGQKKSGSGAAQGGWSVDDTASLFNKSRSSVSEDIHLADAIEILPDLKKCKSKAEADKKVAKLMEEMALAELQKRLKKESSDPTVKEAALKVEDIYQIGDCVLAMKAMPEKQGFTIAEVDPPYAIGLHEIRVGEVPKDYKECKAEDYPGLLSDVARELYRLLEDDAWVIWWYGPTHQQLVLNTLQHHGFTVDEIPCIWLKDRGQTLQPNINFARFWEPFFVARKGKPQLAKRGRGNVFHFAGVSSQSRSHPTERPVELIQEIVSHLSPPGYGKIIVPFLGSGNTLIAAKRCGIDGIGWDLHGERAKIYFTERYLKDLERENTDAEEHGDSSDE